MAEFLCSDHLARSLRISHVGPARKVLFLVIDLDIVSVFKNAKKSLANKRVSYHMHFMRAFKPFS